MCFYIERDAKVYEIGAGTSEVRRLVIGRALNQEYKQSAVDWQHVEPRIYAIDQAGNQEYKKTPWDWSTFHVYV